MTIAAPLDLNEWFNDQTTKFLVILPTSNSPKPVHVLNGFFHNCLSGQRSFRPAVDLVATSDRNPGGWAIGNDQLLEKTRLKLPKEDFRLDRLRRAVRSLIASDGAVFLANASFQLAHLGLVTSDRTHFRLGELAARLAFLRPEAPELIRNLTARLRQAQPNPYWAIEKLLSDDATVEALDVKDPSPATWWAEEATVANLAEDLAGLVIRALQLSVQSKDSLLGLQTLAYSATFAGLLAFAQVPEILVSGGQPYTLLCEAGDPGSLSTVRAASAESLNRVDQSFREYLYTALRAEIVDRFDGAVPDGSEAVTYIQQCKQKKLAGGRELAPEKLRELYVSWRADYDPEISMARTLEEALASAMGNKPRDWFSAVGRHCGFVGPRRGPMPRLRIEVALAPALVLAGIDEDDDRAVPMSVWSDRLAERFGLVFGPSERAREMAQRAAEDELEQNQIFLARLLSSLGLARRYSDGVTEVLNPLKIWAKQ
ncbi:hypothetical protein [Mycobacterium sp. E2699]|uniref:hypothetical protein n=1 Tax=Mycobacterium sp. E2699 TaxID=1834137 RepID=UPI000A58E2D2|nr:hypothetical protein [Mycobacterium sp. E2699]